jgi:hypothetical protein
MVSPLVKWAKKLAKKIPHERRQCLGSWTGAAMAGAPVFKNFSLASLERSSS